MRRPSVTVPVSIAAVVACACSRTKVQADPSAAPSASVAASAASFAPGATPTTAAASSTAGAAASDPAARVKRFFAGFVDGSDFSFLHATCAPRMTRFIGLRDVDVEAAIRTSRAFFKNLNGVKYDPDVKAMQVETVPVGTRVRLPVEMTWSRPMTTDEQQAMVEPDNLQPLADMNLLKIDRDVTADVELVFDASGAIVSYSETVVRMPQLRATGDQECDKDPPKGTILRDLGETAVVWWISIGPAQTVRKVRLNGQDTWVTTQRAVYGGGPGPQDRAYYLCLEPVGDAGK
jgi:hypothetical protein